MNTDGSIKRREFLRFGAGFLAAGFCPSCLSLGKPAKVKLKKPNVIVIVVDDLGYADMSFRPHCPADVKTPGIDRLAKSGTFFTDAYSTSPICSPSRVGLLTGRYQQRWGNYWYGQGGLPANELTLPQALKKLGYVSKKIGKTHLNGGPVQHPLDHGFDEFLGFIHHTWDYLRLSEKDVEHYGKKNAKNACIGPLIRNREKASYENSFTTDIFTNEAVEYINRDHGGKPFYIELEYNAVHHPTYVTHPDYLEKFGIEQFPFWDPKKESWWQWHKKWGHLGEVDPDGRKRYLTHLMVMDKGIGKIIDELNRSGKRENTIVVFLSDNGGTINTYSNNAPLRGYKYMFGEGGVRIPLMVSYPGKLPAGQEKSALVSAMDIFPTILSLAGGDLPNNLDGKNLIPLIKGKAESQHNMICWSKGDGTWTIRKGYWKLCSNIGWKHLNYKFDKDGNCVRDTHEYVYPKGTLLFNLKDDIAEEKNLADKYPTIVKEMTAAYKKWRSEMSDPRNSKGELIKRKKPSNSNGKKKKKELKS